MTMLLLSLALALSPQQAAIRALADQDVRVATIGHRLAKGALAPPEAKLCGGQVMSMPGLIVQDVQQYNVSLRADARAALALKDGPTVVAVLPNTSADRAGLKPGDEIVAIDGVGIPPDGRDPYARMTIVDDRIESGMVRGGVALTIRRDGKEQRISYPAEPGCLARFQMVPGGSLNAVADGSYVQINGKLLGLAANDDGVAAVLAHELAHNVLRHRVLKTPSKQAEYEADRLSVWLVARAGYDLDAIMPFWQALRKRRDYGIFADGSHPGWSKRLAALAAAVAEVKAQKAAGIPLVPPAKEGASQPPKPR